MIIVYTAAHFLYKIAERGSNSWHFEYQSNFVPTLIDPSLLPTTFESFQIISYGNCFA